MEESIVQTVVQHIYLLGRYLFKLTCPTGVKASHPLTKLSTKTSKEWPWASKMREPCVDLNSVSSNQGYQSLRFQGTCNYQAGN